MEKKKDYTLHLLFLVAILAALLNVPGCYKGGQKEAANSLQSYDIATDTNAFHIGDTLLPDYSHTDTLIVIDANSLNWIFDGVDLPVPATDSEIDSTIRLYCYPISGHICRWKLCPYKGINPKPMERKGI